MKLILSNFRKYQAFSQKFYQLKKIFQFIFTKDKKISLKRKEENEKSHLLMIKINPKITTF